VRVFVLTVSDTRTDETDTAGRAIIERLLQAGHAVAGKTIAQSRQEHFERSFARAVNVIALPSAVTGDGTDNSDAAVSLRLHTIGECGEQGET